MIVVDTSALIAILSDEPEADECAKVLAEADRILMSAGTLAEAMIVAGQRHVRDGLLTLIEKLGIEIMPLTEAGARLVAEAYGTFGKGLHAAKLNFGDCFAYALAKEQRCPLLYIGNDFAKTDIDGALGKPPSADR